MRTSLLAVLVFVALGACKREAAATAPDRAAPDPGSGSGGARAERPEPEPSSIARVGGSGRLDPSPKQLADGVPLLRFRVELADSPTRGPRTAPVTIVMFSDFECQFCLHADLTIREVEELYPGKIQFVYKAFPIDRHPHALMAALVAHSAQEQGRFWPMYERLYSGRGLEPDRIQSYVSEVGLNIKKVSDDLDRLTHAPAVRRDMRQAKRLDIRSTPMMFINGRPISGARPIDELRSIVDEELALLLTLTDRNPSVTPYDLATRHAYTSVVYEEAQIELDEDSIYPVPIGDSPQRGPSAAPITIVAFGDFECPFCARGDRTVSAVRDRYGDLIRMVHKQFPLPGHEHAMAAARATMAAHEQGKFWAFHDALYEREARFTDADLELIAMRLKLDVKRFNEAMSSTRFDSAIEADLQLGQALGVTGTPAYFVNGRPLNGARSEMEFRMLIVEELLRVEELKRQGVAPEAMYDRLTRTKQP